MSKKIKFTVECEMNERWMPYFLSMLKSMEYNGNIGHSGKVSIYADGDGDFRPKFKFDETFEKVDPIKNTFQEIIWDAG